MSAKKLFIILAFLLFVSFAKAEDIRMDLVSYEPTVLTPGNYFNAVFEVENTGNTNISDIKFELSTDSSLNIESDEIKKIFILEPGNPQRLNYKLRVDSDSSSGYKELTLEYDNDDHDSEKFSVFVGAIETNLVLNSIKQQDLVPGSNAKLTINLENRASYKLKDIKISLDLTNVPLAPVGSSNEKTISLLDESGKQSVDFDIIALPSSESGVYKIPIKITYFDEFARSYNITSMISLTISAYPYLDINIEKNTLVENTKSTITVKFVNRGLTNIKFLNVKLIESNYYDILSSDNFYLGDVGVDDYQSVDFDLLANNAGDIILPMTVSYKDANNKDYTSVINLNANVYSIEEAKRIGLVNSSSSLYIIIPLLFIVIYIIYRIYKRKKTK